MCPLTQNRQVCAVSLNSFTVGSPRSSAAPKPAAPRLSLSSTSAARAMTPAPNTAPPRQVTEDISQNKRRGSMDRRWSIDQPATPPRTAEQPVGTGSVAMRIGERPHTTVESINEEEDARPLMLAPDSEAVRVNEGTVSTPWAEHRPPKKERRCPPPPLRRASAPPSASRACSRRSRVLAMRLRGLAVVPVPSSRPYAPRIIGGDSLAARGCGGRCKSPCIADEVFRLLTRSPRQSQGVCMIVDGSNNHVHSPTSSRFYLLSILPLSGSTSPRFYIFARMGGVVCARRVVCARSVSWCALEWCVPLGWCGLGRIVCARSDGARSVGWCALVR